MTDDRKTDLAVLLAPLVLVARFLWPFVPFGHTLADVALAFLAAYMFFFLARFLGRLALAFIGRTSPQLLLSMSFLAADAISLLVRFSVAGMTSGNNGDRELRGAALDSLWCTVAIAIAEWRNLRRREEGGGGATLTRRLAPAASRISGIRVWRLHLLSSSAGGD